MAPRAVGVLGSLVPLDLPERSTISPPVTKKYYRHLLPDCKCARSVPRHGIDNVLLSVLDLFISSSGGVCRKVVVRRFFSVSLALV